MLADANHVSEHTECKCFFSVQPRQLCGKKEAANTTSWVGATRRASHTKGSKKADKLVLSNLMQPSYFQVLLDEEKIRSAEESARAEEWKSAVEHARVMMERQQQAFIEAGLSWPEEEQQVHKKEKQGKTKRQRKVNKRKLHGQGKWARKGRPEQRSLAGLDKMPRTSMFYMWPERTHHTTPNTLTATCNQYPPNEFSMKCSEKCSVELFVHKRSHAAGAAYCVSMWSCVMHCTSTCL